jgi:hypothetical protein
MSDRNFTESVAYLPLQAMSLSRVSESRRHNVEIRMCESGNALFGRAGSA